MSVNEGTSKKSKRRLSEDDEGTNKRFRTEGLLENKTRVKTEGKNSQGKNLAANRLNLLRQSIKKASRPVQQAKVATNKPSNVSVTENVIKAKPYVVKDKSITITTDIIEPVKANFTKGSSNVPLNPSKRRSVNERLKRTLNKKNDDDDDTIIIIDNSPLLYMSSSSDEDSPKKNKGSIKTRLNEGSGSKRTSSGAVGLSDSFLVISEASFSEEDNSARTPVKRLRKASRTSSSSTSSKTLTPGSDEVGISPLRSVKGQQNSSGSTGGLRVPLNRNILKTCQTSPVNEDDFNTPKDPPKQDVVFQRTFRAKIMSTKFKKGYSPTKIYSSRKELEDGSSVTNETSINNNKSPPKSIFGAKICQVSPIQRTSPNNSNIFKQSPGSSQGDNEKRPLTLADRIARIRNQGSSTPKCTPQIPEQHSSVLRLHKMESELFQEVRNEGHPAKNNELPTTSENRPSSNISKVTLVQNWMESNQHQSSNCDQTISDSLLVNCDDTLLNKSELMTEGKEDDSMEWDAISVVTDCVKPPESISTSPLDDSKKEKIMCVVTDTNVFMHDLHKVKDLLNFKMTGGLKLKIYVPWMVQQELDYFKDTSSYPQKSIALTAQKFINKHLVQADSKIIGQSVTDVCQQIDLGKSPDDKILACCLQAKNKYESVILLSNDVSLCNKALTNDIKAYTPKEILGKLRGSKFLKIKVRLQTLLSQIVYHSCMEAFGDACFKMELLQDSPWSFEGCLKRFKRYWSTVFGQLLLKQCLRTIEELIAITNRGEMVDSDLKDFDRFKDKVKEFLFYLQDIEQFNGAVKKMREEIDKIVDDSSCL